VTASGQVIGMGATNPPHDVPRILPHLVYDDVGGAVEWLTRAFGFRERVAYRHAEPDGTVSRTQLEVVDSLITVGAPSVHADTPRHGVSSMLYVYVDDVDAHFEGAVAAGAVVVLPLEDVPWGDRRYQVTDPEGHQWTFATHVHDAVADDCH